jgi:transcriptional regulator with XRE-family HTH domain
MSWRRPSFGGHLRLLRNLPEDDAQSVFPGMDPRRRRVTGQAVAYPRRRTELAAVAKTATDYLAKLEQGKATNPSTELVIRLATALGVSEVERLHLLDLARYSRVAEGAGERPAPPTITADQKKFVDNLGRNLTLAAYVDAAWNVWDANCEYKRIYRGLVQRGNVLLWFFGEPLAKAIMVEWEREARLTVARFRALMAGWPGNLLFDDVLDQLYGNYSEFREMWDRDDVLMRRPTPYMKVRDLERSETLTLQAEVFPTPDRTETMQLYLGVRA